MTRDQELDFSSNLNKKYMWIKRNNVIVNTDNVCAIQQQGDKVIFRFSGTSSASTIDRAALSAEVVFKDISSATINKIWKSLSEGENMMEL